jgi:4-hydroxy-tetrahydrodipicolinate synthase
LSGAEIEAAHAVAPNLVAAKTAPPDWREAAELIDASPSIRHFVTEAAFPFAHGCGAAGLIPSSNYTNPERTRAFHQAVLAGDLATAARLHRAIVRFFNRTATPLGRKGYVDGAIDKAYARLGGMDIPLWVRPPYVPLSEADFAWLEAEVRRERTEG